MKEITEEENRARVYHAFKEINSNYSSKHLVALDFDELLVTGHLSKAVINALQGEQVRKSILAEHPDYSFEAIARLSISAVHGMSEEEAIARKETVVREMPWRKHAVDFLKVLKEDKKYTPLILSCGRYRSIRMKLDQEGLEDIPVIATEITYENGTAINKHIMTDELKGEAMKQFRHHFKRTDAIGHIKGDIPMLQAADVGIALREQPRNIEVEKIADHTVDDLIEAYFVLKL